MFKKYKSLFSLMTSVCSFSVWRQKILSPQDLKNASELNILTLWDNWPVHVHMLQYFFLIRRNFWSSLEVLQTLYFFNFFFILHGIIYQYKILLCVIYTKANRFLFWKDISNISGIFFLILYPRDIRHGMWLSHEKYTDDRY